MDEQSLAYGRVRNTNAGKEICIDHLQRDMAHKLSSYILGEYPCHPFLGDSQYFSLSKKGALRNEYMCGEVTKNKVNDVWKTPGVKSMPGQWFSDTRRRTIHECMQHNIFTDLDF